jgi:hypothetical protein
MNLCIKNREVPLALYQFYFEIVFNIQEAIPIIIECCLNDKSSYLTFYQHLINEIQSIEKQENYFKYIYKTYYFDDNPYRVIDYQPYNQELSIHVQLTRLFNGLYSKIDAFALDYFSILNQIDTNHKEKLKSNCYLNILEPSLRSIIYITQINKKLSNENQSIFMLNVRQADLYSNINYRKQMLEADLLCLQTAASIMNPNQFLINILVHLNLYEYLVE